MTGALALAPRDSSSSATTVPQSPGFERLLRPFWSGCVHRLLTQFATEICCSLLQLLYLLQFGFVAVF